MRTPQFSRVSKEEDANEKVIAEYHHQIDNVTDLKGYITVYSVRHDKNAWEYIIYFHTGGQGDVKLNKEALDAISSITSHERFKSIQFTNDAIRVIMNKAVCE